MTDSMKKVLVINGSPRKGNTFHLAGVVADELKRLGGVEVEYLHLSEKRIEPCRGCGLCMTHGFEKCPIHDDVPWIIAAIQQSDGVILASPVYVYHISGLTKILLDRLGAYFHRPAFFGRHAMALATTGFFGTAPTLKYMKSVLGALGFSTVVTAGGQARDLEDRFIAKLELKAREAARRFHRNLCRGCSVRPSFASLMQFSFQRKCFTHPGVGRLFPADMEHYTKLAGRIFPVDVPVDLPTRVSAWAAETFARLFLRIT
ncbi:MAG: NAD(P)H-dependent oxidoreductase [Candidatus Fermentibacter sp.]|nr:NAD(P)H-dependent oxidoreductase [Candidatus Fermentibacter sp.]